MNSNNFEKAQSIANSLNKENVKFVKKETGLLEREKNSDKIILAEDNRQILLG